MSFKSDFEHTHTLSIREYNDAIRSSFYKITIIKRMRFGRRRLALITREIAVIKYCKIMIRYVQSQLN